VSAPNESQADVGDVVAPAVLDRVGSGLVYIDKHKGSVALIVSGYVVVKVLVVARGDLDTALEIVRSAGAPQVVLGGVLSGLPLLAAALAGLSAFRLGRHLHRWRGERPPSWRDDLRWAGSSRRRFAAAWAVGVLTELMALVFTPVVLLVPVVGLGLFAGVLAARRVDPDCPSGLSLRWRLVFAGLWVLFAVLGVAAIGALLYTVWTPHEHLVLNGDAEQSRVGYVLDERGGWLTLLVSGRRTIEEIKSSSVTARVVCHTGDAEGRLHISALQIVYRLDGHHFGVPPRHCLDPVAAGVSG